MFSAVFLDAVSSKTRPIEETISCHCNTVDMLNYAASGWSASQYWVWICDRHAVYLFEVGWFNSVWEHLLLKINACSTFFYHVNNHDEYKFKLFSGF